MRRFRIPLQAPVNGTGRGTRDDPWRPKYLQELGLDFSSFERTREHMCCVVSGDEAALDHLAQYPDVEEL